MNEKQTKVKLPLKILIRKRIDMILDKKKLILGLLTAGLILGALLSFLLPKLYRASGSINFVNSSVNSQLLTNSGSLSNEISYLQSDELIKETIEKLAQRGLSIGKNDILNSCEIVENKSSVALGINFISNDAEKSAEIVNLFIQKLSEKSLLNSKLPYLSALSIISEREETLEEEIKKSFAGQQGAQIITLGINEEQLITRIAEFESELESIELINNYYSENLQNLQKLLEESYPIISSNILLLNNSNLSETKTKYERLETKNLLATVSQKLGNIQISYPWEEVYDLRDLQNIRTEFNLSLEKLVDDLAENREISNLEFLKKLSQKLLKNQVMVNAIDFTKLIIFNTMTELEQSFNRIPYTIIDAARQSRIKKFNNSLALKLKTEKIRLKQKESDFFAVIESVRNAEKPKTYFSPNTTLNIILGGIIGLVIGLFLSLFSNSKNIELIKSTDDLEESGYKIIAQIPSFAENSPILFDSLSQIEKRNVDKKVINAFEGISVFLKYGSLDKPLKTIMVTSGQDGEGKSIIAANTAISLANSGNKVLLVDADLKNPQLHKYFKIKSTPSLAHYLFGKKELEEVIRSTHNPNLSLVTCIEFPQNPAAIIISERMKNFMNEVKEDYDHIVYDTSSLCSLKETAVIASIIDEVILVVRANKSKISEMIAAETLLKEKNVFNLNIVLNDIKT